VPDEASAAVPVLTFHAVQPRASPRRLCAVPGARRPVVHKSTATCG